MSPSTTCTYRKSSAEQPPAAAMAVTLAQARSASSSNVPATNVPVRAERGHPADVHDAVVLAGQAEREPLREPGTGTDPLDRHSEPRRSVDGRQAAAAAIRAVAWSSMSVLVAKFSRT